MDPQLQTSFIPKKSLVETPTYSSGGSLFNLILTTIFILSLLISGVLFFYLNFLDSKLTSSIDTLKTKEERFDTGTIEKFLRLNNRIEAANQILSHHVAVTPLFTALEGLILHSIRFVSLNFASDDSGKMLLTMTGQASGYSSIAYQSDVITKNNRCIQNPIFSNLNLDQSGNVGFSFSANVKPSLLSYESLLSNQSQPCVTGVSSQTP